jgi:hypothetical protein
MPFLKESLVGLFPTRIDKEFVRKLDIIGLMSIRFLINESFVLIKV